MDKAQSGGIVMLNGAIGLSSLVYLYAAQRGLRGVVYVLKPGTMALIIALAWLRLGAGPASVYGWAVLAALLVSVVGDVALMLPDERWFPVGLGAFLLAHVAYIGGLWSGSAGVQAWHLAPALGMALWCGWFLRRLVPALREKGKGRLVGPVVVYATVLAAMVWSAVCFGSPWVAVGALLFCVSDSVLAWDRFVRPLPLRHVLVMATYFGAQWLFAWSVGG
jgi:uncharacterized membrane protein YhhN